MTAIRHAMIAAAGLGTRMRPITNDRPKAMVEVCGRTLLDHALDRLLAAGITQAVVNVHHFADVVERHLRQRTDIAITISDERDELLETGGGVVKALPFFGDGPFIVMNADTLWIEGVRPNLARMMDVFDPAAMDGLLLLASSVGSIGYDGRGDFRLDPGGRLTRRPEREVTPFVYAGACILKPELFADAPRGPFSLNRVFDAAIGRERLFGLRMEGLWLHVGTPGAITAAEQAIALSTG